MFGQLIHQLLSLFHQYFNSLLRTQVIFFGRLPPDILIIHRLVNPMTLSTLSRSGSGHCLGTITPSRTGSSRRSRHFLLKHAKSVLSRCQNSCVSGIRSVGSSKKNRGNYAPGAWKCASTHLWLRFSAAARTLMEQWHLMKEDEHQIYCLLGRLDDMGRAILWDLTTSAFNWSCSW